MHTLWKKIERSAPTAQRGRKAGRSEAVEGTVRPASETVERPDTRVPACAYAIRAREEQDAPNVIVGTFSLFNSEVHALIDPGSTHSYMCTAIPVERGLKVETIEQDILVTNPLGHNVMVNEVYRGYPLTIQEYEFLVDHIELPFHEFNVIFGMDWLSRHQAMMDCRLKKITLMTPNNEEIIIVGERMDYLSNVISATTVGRLIRKGCEAYLAHVIDTRKVRLDLHDIPIVCDFPDVFPEELPGIPPEREVEFAIEVMHRTTPVSIALFRMAVC
ncbi:uncharacterized protein LOC131169346 [Hevea brasiliensis]|uniref:uncharacterized protein LOC131169346 n=1 Tax=Hevea brasiliensis TaxID=3981 RepID=UPI0025FDA8F9|nr:uncharacterized protein LOC131169346 [Hevea brasiliensis]